MVPLQWLYTCCTASSSFQAATGAASNHVLAVIQSAPPVTLPRHVSEDAEVSDLLSGRLDMSLGEDLDMPELPGMDAVLLSPDGPDLVLDSHLIDVNELYRGAHLPAGTQSSRPRPLLMEALGQRYRYIQVYNHITKLPRAI